MITLIALWDQYASKYFERLTQMNIVVLTIGYIFITYIGYQLCGEETLVADPLDFIYFLSITASTIGYGDMSPVTQAGRLFTALWVAPFALALFGLLIAKGAAFFSNIWYRRNRGRHMLTLRNHIVILGYKRSSTEHLIRMIQREEKGRRDVVLVSVEQEINPLGNDIHFIHANNFTDIDDLHRANIAEASCIVVNTSSDEMTLTIALYVSKLNTKADLVANFVDDIKCRILTEHLPNAECISSHGTELLAKSIIDSGSSLIHSELVSTHKGQTQYSIKVPDGIAAFTLNDVFMLFKQEHDATIIAVRKSGQRDVEINTLLSTPLTSGDQIFYIADERINLSDTHWPNLKNEHS